MSTFPTTAIDHLFAGDPAAFRAYIEGAGSGWQERMLDAVGSAIEHVTRAVYATSSTFVQSGTGSKTWVLDSPRGWRAGTMVLIMDTLTPDTRYFLGDLETDEYGGGTIDVNVIQNEGGGGSSWQIAAFLDFQAAAFPRPPLMVAYGGTAGDSIPLAVANLGMARQRSVLSVVSTPPGSPIDGDLHIVGDAPTGAFAGQDNNWAERITGAWEFEDPAAGDLSYDESTGLQYIFTSAPDNELWPGSLWRHNSEIRALPELLTEADDTRVFTADEIIDSPALVVDAATTAPFGIVLPFPINLRLAGQIVEIMLDTDHDLTITVNSGRINDLGSIKLTTRYDYARLLATGSFQNWIMLDSKITPTI